MRRVAVIFAACLCAPASDARALAGPKPPLGTGGARPAGGLIRGAPPIAEAQRLASSRSVRGLGPRLAARIRSDGEDALQSFAARGLTRAMIEAAGGTVRAELGPILAGTLSGRAIRALAPSATLIDAPAPLHPLLDVSRAAIGADVLDQGRDLPARYRGRGALIASYDSGIDLFHPDLRELGGATRVVALWDQALPGTPPAGQTQGLECTHEMLAADTCPTTDPVGHGTHVISIAAGNGPHYRGIAPEAGLVIARSNDFLLFFETLDWFRAVAESARLPLVVNLSLGGHEGPHDGTSLESQAIDAYPYLVVAASGNEGVLPVHAQALLAAGDLRDIALRFPTYPTARDQSAVVDVWGDAGAELGVSVLIVKSGGDVVAKTSSVSLGSAGRTETLVVGAATLGTAKLDAAAGLDPFNGEAHVRVELAMKAWQDEPAGPGYVVVRLNGTGGADLWVDTPPEQEAPVSFDQDAVLGLDTEVTADVNNSVSDPATAVSAIAVAAYTTRLEFPSPRGMVTTPGGVVGAIAKFSSFGPTRAPEKTGPKPDLAAPGFVIVGARSRNTPASDNGMVTELYRASAGTSMAAPHVAGVAALILGAKPAATKFDLKQSLLASAAKQTSSNDTRWGAGRLDAAAALRSALGLEEGCSCTLARSGDPRAMAHDSPHGAPWALIPAALLLLGIARRKRIP